MWLICLITLVVLESSNCALAHLDDVARFRRHLALRQAVMTCAESEEGHCRSDADPSMIQLCGSGMWQHIPRGQSCCNNSLLSFNCPGSIAAVPDQKGAGTSGAPAVAPSLISSAVIGSGSAAAAATACAITVGQTGNSFCSKTSPPCHTDKYGKASYSLSGRMASVYDAAPSDAFRCNIHPPSNGFYVAFWTPFTPSVASQPQPKSCGAFLKLTNPSTGVSANAQVIDRCASCVGVGHQTSDPNTPDSLVNGATVDLSRQLWNFLFNNAPDGVYDIEYTEEVYYGSNATPAILEHPQC